MSDDDLESAHADWRAARAAWKESGYADKELARALLASMDRLDAALRRLVDEGAQ